VSASDKRKRSRSSQGLLTILFTDIESSVRTTQRLGDDRAQQMVRAHNAIVRRALELNGGTEVKHTGDGIMATFTSARRAVACAVAIQAASIEHNDGHSELAFNIRIGLNAGEPVTEDADVFGTAVQLAARVCARAEPGKILASDVVRQLVAGKGLLFADIGPAELKGFEEAVHLYEIRAEAGAEVELLDEPAGLGRLFGVPQVRVAIGFGAIATVLVAVVGVALLVSGDDDGESPGGPADGVASAVSPSPGATATASVLPIGSALGAADAEDIRDLIDRYSAKSVEAYRTQNLAGLDAIAIAGAFTRLADAVDELDSQSLVVEATRESIAVGTPVLTAQDAAVVKALEIWTRCAYERDSHELANGERTGSEATYSLVRSDGRWYIESVDIAVSSEDEYDGCEACGALRAGCEAVVTNVAPLNLFVRAAPDREAQVKGRLPDRTVVCVTGTSQVADGLTWWPVKATIASGPVDGWSADHEPNPPGAVLLEATGQRCQ
jgi:class 3 adenylate cyclase